MNNLTKLIAASAFALGVAAAAAPSSATTIFADFDTGASNSRNFTLASTGSSATVFTAGSINDTAAEEVNVNFSFLGDAATSDFFDLASKFYFNASTSTAATYDGATYTQTGISGNFYFKYAGANTTLNGFAVNTGDILFSGTFSDAWIQGNGGVGGIDVTVQNGGSATFASNFYDLSRFNPGTEEYTFHLGAVNPEFGAAGITPGGGAQTGTGTLNSFRAHAAGEFQGTVPEPATWALMIMGFGGAGAMLRRRKVVAA